MVGIDGLRADESQAGPQDSRINAGVEESGAKSPRSEAVAVSSREALDEAVEAQAPKVVAHAARADLSGAKAEQRSDLLAEILVRETPGNEHEEQERVQECLHPGVAEAKRGGAPPVDLTRTLQILEGILAERAVVTDSLDVEKTSVGLKADSTKRRQVVDPPADAEVARVVDGGLGAKGLPFLVVLLDAASLVVDVKRGSDPLGQHAGAKPSRGSPSHPPVEDQLRLPRAPDVEVLADDLLEEHPSGHGPVEHLSERKLRLKDRQLVAVAGPAIAAREGVRQLGEPLAKQPIDLGLGEPVADLLQRLGVLAPPDPVVERLEADAALLELTLGVLVAVDAKLGVVRKVRTEFQEERAEILVRAVRSRSG
jgi:hypothetical protein